MKILFTIVVILALLMVGAAIYVRTASIDVTAFSAPPVADGSGYVATANSFQAARQITTTPEGVLQALDSVATATPRTQVVAGSVAEGTITWETRSRIFGYPDFTTATVSQVNDAPLLIVKGQARYGQSDMGVNKARVTGWLAQLGPLVKPAS